MTTALYRRYRPQTFAEVIGQDHVTAPLRAALRSGQVNHAYLFSGPRGCGKTSSARILARILNCEQNTPEHPTDTPCGVCASCVELATGGPGSLDVVEIDAASHGGVDDARELRERATFAPARDRYKVFIIDEAHMVSNQGFNALLKIVEEPPPHVRFVFATTEPDKVLATIRSRTHHYPFRLVPPDVLVPFLQHVCEQEGVPVGSGVLPLVVRAGAGSVRDSLSVLDQLIAGSGGHGLEYEGAVALLGYTPAALLDDLVDAVAARDGATAFSVVERVIATGHDPRRFVEDLLERLRDLIVIAASGPAAEAALGALPADQLERMAAQATHLGRSELSRSADLANTALTEMVGATSPRLHLELLMARLLLPAADDGTAGYGARLDRLERGWPAGASVASTVPPSVAAATDVPAAPTSSLAPLAAASIAEVPVAAAPITASVAVVEAPADEAPVPPADEPAEPERARTRPAERAQAEPEPAETEQPGAAAAAQTPHGPGAQDTEMLRRRWPEVLENVKGLRRASWILVGQNAQVHDLDSSVLRLSFPTPGLVDRFRDHAEVIARAVRETLGFDVRVQAVLAGAPASGGGTPTEATAATVPAGSSGGSWSAATGPHGIPSAAQAAASWDVPAGASSAAAVSRVSPVSRAPAMPQVPAMSLAPSAPNAVAPTAPEPEPESDDDPGDVPLDPPDDDLPDEPPPDDVATTASTEDDPSPDDPLIEGSNLVGPPLVARLLGGTVIDEQVDDPGR
ncbi:MAG TPA: DNA polymerase III subunit gamma and tau [Cellulomonas sp.]